MPAVPYVFRPVKSGDVQLRPFKAYKSYTLRSNTDYSSSGYRVHNALQNLYPVHVGVDSYNYPINAIDGTNQHVVWRNIDHRYYRYPYDNSRCHELTNNRTTEKYLAVSASIFTIPYFDVGERIKPGSVTLYAKPMGNDIHTLLDDGYGNLRDSIITTSSFASASNLMFYMSFNDEYRKFEKQFGSIVTGSIKYILDKQELNAECRDIEITSGVTLSNNTDSGIAAKFIPTSYVRIPHNDKLNKINSTSTWTISFWYYVDVSNISELADADGFIVASKYSLGTETYISPESKTLQTRDVRVPYPKQSSNETFLSTVDDWSKYKTPIHIELISDYLTGKLRYICGNGSTAKILSTDWGTLQTWHHCVIVNDGSTVSMYIDNTLETSDTMPIGTLNNTADLIFGTGTNVPVKLDEVRIYDYAVTVNEINSLAGNHYLSGSLYQTNVAGNVFYRNGQIVISSLLTKYNSGSGFFSNEWTASWKGTHTIYENEVMVRIPADQFNYSVNPTVSYSPATIDTTADIEKYNGPGSLYKSIFTGSLAKPYITTVGLYNDKAQLLAVGKLAQPVQKRDDVDMNIIVRWDY